MAGKRPASVTSVGTFDQPQRSPAVMAGKSMVVARGDVRESLPQRSPAVMAGKSWRLGRVHVGPEQPQRSPAVMAGKRASLPTLRG